jgi:cell division protein FtsX
MPEPDDRLDDRLRTELRSLDDAARQRVRPPGADAVPPAARRRRGTLLAAAAAVALVVAGGTTAGWRFARPVPAGAPPCAPAQGAAFLPADGADADPQARVGAILHDSPAVESAYFETREEAWERFKRQFSDAPDLVAATKPESLPESWRFVVRCSVDYSSVEAQLDAVPGVDVVRLDRPVVKSGRGG